MIEIIDFSKVFDTENAEEYLRKINEIPKSLLIDTATYLLSFYHDSPLVSDHTELLLKWFGHENNELASNINDKINTYVAENSKQIGILNARTSLTLFEQVLSSEDTAPAISNSDFEILLFKIYLALNEQLNKNDNLIIDSANKTQEYPKIYSLAIGNSLPTFDITNFAIFPVFVSQVLKSIFLLEFLESRDDSKKLLSDFYSKFEVKNYREFLSKLLPISFNVISTLKGGKIDLILNEDDDFEANSQFLDKLTVNQSTYYGDDIDYLNLRANPLYKIDRLTYRIIYPLFTIEKNFNGLYFLLKEVNGTYPKKDQINLRQIVTFDFSEKYILYALIERTYRKKYFKLAGEQMKTPGTPDYYIRNGNKIFLFESKDILINATIKDSYDYEQYEAAIKDKLYYSTEKKESPKAVKQLANFSRTILNGTFSEDRNYKPKSAKIYPIILLHNRQLDILGLNNLINFWFKTEANLIENDSINIKNLRMPTIISIDTLISMHERLAKGELDLDVIIDEYQEWINEEVLRNKKFKNVEEQETAAKNMLISFNMFFEHKYNWTLPNLFREKAMTILEKETPST